MKHAHLTNNILKLAYDRVMCRILCDTSTVILVYGCATAYNDQGAKEQHELSTSHHDAKPAQGSRSSALRQYCLLI